MPRIPVEQLEEVLKALGSANRLRLLEVLQTPKGYGEIELAPSREDEWGSQMRAISRQAIRHHVRELMDIGVVSEAQPDVSGELRYVVHHARLFGVVESLRQLAVVKSTVEIRGNTMDLEARTPSSEVSGPHLVLVRGVEEGRPFPLGTNDGEWRLGRARGTEVCLDYDPYVSGEHARVLRKESQFFLVDLAQNKNGTMLNWNRMVRGGIAPLRSGDVIGLGMSLLVFRG